MLAFPLEPAAGVAHLAPGNSRFIVLAVLNKGDGAEDKGSPNDNAIMKLNGELAATYGSNFLDIRSFMVNQARSSPAGAYLASARSTASRDGPRTLIALSTCTRLRPLARIR